MNVFIVQFVIDIDNNSKWKKIIKRIGADTIRQAYAVGVALEDNEK